MQEKALAYARQVLAAHHMDTARPGQSFRTRSSHMERVCLWVERLLAQGGVEDPRALRLAAALHDVGYVHAEEGHGAHSARMLLAYAQAEGIDPAVAERAAFLAREHSNKAEWMKDPEAPRDLLLLMEADLLDEEGAMGLVLDCLSAGAEGQDYLGAYARMQRYEPARLAHNPMVTPLARDLWAEKQRIIRGFMQAYAMDLGIEDET